MDSSLDSVFDAARWDHWLLVVSFLGLAVCGLRLSWQWRCAAKRRRRTARGRRLVIEAHRRQIDELSAQVLPDQALSDQALSNSALSDENARAQAVREKVRVTYSSSSHHLSKHLNVDI